MVLSTLSPARVFYYFETLCSIPHGSGNMKAVSDYCVEFAKRHNLTHYQDALGNVIIKKPASGGCEQSPPVILQGHLDMVCEKEPDSPIDFSKDGLSLRTDGDFIFADGTTLGADDGIAVAMALAVLENEQIEHPPLEVLLTVDEEIGMLGAEGLDASLLQGKRLLNLDSEAEGVLTAGCAGGLKAAVSIPLPMGACAQDACKLMVSGLLGGHSGGMIASGRANAAVVLGRVVSRLQEVLDARFVRAESGTKDNAIPCRAEAVLALDDSKFGDARSLVEKLQAVLRKEYANVDPDISLSLIPCGVCDRAFTVQATKKACFFLSLCPNGVYSMSSTFQNLPQASDNLGIFSLQDGLLSADILIRSSLESQKALLADKIRRLAEALGGSMQSGDSYCAWEYREQSSLRQTMLSCYQTLFGTTPVVDVVHGGLECGILCGKIQDLDAVSFGPDIADIHTTAERLSVSSVNRTWEYLLFVLKSL